MDNAGPDGAFFYIVSYCNFTERVCVEFYWTILKKKQNNVCNNTLHLALKYVEHCQSGVLFVTFGCLDGRLFKMFTAFDRVCITTHTKQAISSHCDECIEGLSFHVSCFAAVVSCRVTASRLVSSTIDCAPLIRIPEP